MNHVKDRLKGIFPVLPTPLKDNQEVDLDAIQGCIEYYMNTAVNGLTIMGSGGELPYFNDAEHLAIAKKAFATVAGRKPIIVGVNAYGEHQAIVRCQTLGAYASYAMLLLTGYYQYAFDDVLQSLRCIAAASPVPVIYYHFPQVSGLFLSAEQLIQILKIDNIVGIKDSALHRKTANKVLARVPETAYFSGLSLMLPELLSNGGAGAICPISAIAPEIGSDLFIGLINANKQQYGTAWQQLKALLPIANNLNMSAGWQNFALDLLSKSPQPMLKKASSPHAISKEALRQRGMPITAAVRSPLPALSPGDSEKVAQILRGCSLIA